MKLKLEVDFVICPQCSKGPLDNSQEKVDKFLREHASHINSILFQHPRIVGKIISSDQSFLKNKHIAIIAIKFVDEPKKIVAEVMCRWKKCKNYKKHQDKFCSKECKKQYKRHKSRRNK